LENVLKTLKPLTEGRLLCVFGAGGNRDKLKRPKMLQKSLEYADYTFITSDNPRFEKEEEIIRDIVRNADFSQPFWIERNREKAIEIAVSLTTEKDVLLIAGKGHETYQIIGDKKIHFDDKEKALEAMNRKSDSNEDLLAIPIDPLNLELLYQQKMETHSISLTNISTDSRNCPSNSIFFALKGERFDGHDYIDKVLQKEDCIVIAEKKHATPQQNLFFVDDTTKAYGILAKKYQSLFPALKIAITGSMGKTTTKEYLYSVLSDQKPTLKTLENENNQIGLPKTIFRMQPKHRFAIFEIGSNHFGEIAYLTDICQPDFGIVTNVGSVHTEFFGDENGVFREKSSLLIGTKQKIFFPKDDKKFHIFQGIGFGTSSNCKYRVHSIQNKENNITFYVNDDFYQIQTVFKENVYNALAAISIARELQISALDIQKSLAPSISIPLRMQLIKKDGILFLADCYNANPHSMLAAIDTWQSMQPEKPHIAILGDMLELGKEAKQHHLKIAEKLKKCNVKIFVAIGELAKDYNADYYFATVYDFLKADFTSNFPKESIVLVKASHGIHLEKIVEG
jgi:UDP-N-acetylmuramoyl-tripeptide--D-alanyl-D-alanine ligase